MNQQYFDATSGALASKLEQIHGMQGFKAKMTDLHISDKIKTGMVVFDMLEILISEIEDSTLINQQNMSDGYECWTGKALHSDIYDDQ